MSNSNNRADLRRTRELTLRKCDVALAPDEAAELSSLLASSAEARAEYWDTIALHSALEWELRDDEGIEDAINEMKTFTDAPGVAREVASNQQSQAWMWLAAAACLLLSVGAAGIWWRSSARPADLTVASARDSRPALGQVSPLTPGSRWSFGQRGGRNGTTIHQGDTIWLEQGVLEVQLPSETRAVLESPAIMQLVASDRMRMIQGGVKLEVADGDEGFSVETDSAEVIDLGTVFSVKVQGGSTDVVVFDGEVDLKPVGSSAVTADAMGSPNKRFRAGEAVQIAEDGTLSRIVDVRQAPTMSDAAEWPLIASVQDNNHRPDLWSFYEVVTAGFAEDAPAFVDRPHQWNGIDSDGLPAYLQGADYVKTFNDDKITDDLRISVTLARPATLYVLLDTRVAPPEWLLESFQKTDDELGIDEVPFDASSPSTVAPGKLGVGAALSIDRHHSIWQRVVPDGGTVVLGPNGHLLDAPAEGTNSRANMYGLVAVPLVDESLN